MPYCFPIARPAVARRSTTPLEIVDLHVHLLSERDLRECEQHQRRPALGRELRSHLDESAGKLVVAVETGISIVWNSTSTPGPRRAAASAASLGHECPSRLGTRHTAASPSTIQATPR